MTDSCNPHEFSIYIGITFPILSIVSLLAVAGLIAKKETFFKAILGKATIAQVVMLILAVSSGLVRVLSSRNNLISADDCMCKVLKPEFDASLYLIIYGLSGFVGIQMSKFYTVLGLFAKSSKLKKAKKISQPIVVLQGLLLPTLLTLTVGFGQYYVPWVILGVTLVFSLFLKKKMRASLALTKVKNIHRFDEGSEFLNAIIGSTLGLGLPVTITYIIMTLESTVDHTIACPTLIFGSLFWSISTACVCVVIAHLMYSNRLDEAYNPVDDDDWEEVPSEIKCASGYSQNKDTSSALEEVFQSCVRQLNGVMISYVFVNFRDSDDRDVVATVMDKLLPGVPFTGGTTCLGSLSSTGFQADSIGMLAVCDDEDSMYLTAHVEMTDSVSGYDAAKRAAELLKTRAEKRLESIPTAPKLPAVIWMMSAPGCEEDQMKGIKEVYGEFIRIIGGSTADNTVEGKWFQVSNIDVRSSGNGICLAALHPSVEIGSAFFSGYSATSFTGTVTEATGRTISKIDGESAALVYDKWVGGALKDGLTKGKGLNVLGKTTLYPLGIQVGETGGAIDVGDPYYKILHPATLHDNGSIDLFANIKVGDQITCMAGTPKNLQTRIAHTAKHIMDQFELKRSEIVGAVTIFCGGCTLAIGGKNMDIPSNKLSNVLGGVPLMGCHTFGEQGQFSDGTSQHGNLMFSVMVFSNRRIIKTFVNQKTGEFGQKGQNGQIKKNTRSKSVMSARLNSDYYGKSSVANSSVANSTV